MKKVYLTVLLTLFAVVLFAQIQPVMKFETTGKAPVRDPSYAPADDPALPGDELIWAQGVNCEGGLVSSEVISQIGFTSNYADDFQFTSGKNITAARWWFGVFLGAYAPFTTWTITIYDDNLCLPGNIVQQWVIPFNQSHENLQCNLYYPLYSYWASLTPAFTAAPNTTYWMSVQAGDHALTGQWGWSMTLPLTGCSGALQSDFFGYFDYENIDLDSSFELYGTGTAIPETPISNWALFIGVGLIFIAAFIRFRRII